MDAEARRRWKCLRQLPTLSNGADVLDVILIAQQGVESWRVGNGRPAAQSPLCATANDTARTCSGLSDGVLHRWGAEKPYLPETIHDDLWILALVRHGVGGACADA